MKKSVTYFLLVLSCLLPVLMTSGCKKQKETEPVNLAILIGNHANAAAPNLAAARPYIKQACASFGYVSIIVIDGAPYQSAQADIPVPEKALSKAKLESVADEQEEEIIRLARNSTARTPEVDTVKAIQMGVRSLRAAGEGTGRILILDSGLCTAGSLDFTDKLLDSVDADTTADNLIREAALPDMEGIEVVWAGIGDTQEPQKALSQKDIEVLKEVWEKALTSAGAKVEFSSALPSEQPDSSELPPVTAIEVLQPASAIREDGYSRGDAFVLDQETLNFRADSAEFLSDTDTLQEMLSPLADYLKAEKNEQILLCGTTASAGRQDTSVELSKQRCEAVKQLLETMGASQEQILTLGLGYEGHPFRVEDLNSDGSLNEEQARRNRCVIILPKNSKTAQELLGRVW